MKHVRFRERFSPRHKSPRWHQEHHSQLLPLPLQDEGRKKRLFLWARFALLVAFLTMFMCMALAFLLITMRYDAGEHNYVLPPVQNYRVPLTVKSYISE